MWPPAWEALLCVFVLFCVRALEYRQASRRWCSILLSFLCFSSCLPARLPKIFRIFLRSATFFCQSWCALDQCALPNNHDLVSGWFFFRNLSAFCYFVSPPPPFLSFFLFALGEEESHLGAAVSSVLCRDPEAWKKKKQQKKNHHHIIVRGILFVAVHHDATDKHEDGSPLLVCCRGACIWFARINFCCCANLMQQQSNRCDEVRSLHKSRNRQGEVSERFRCCCY